MNNYFALVVSVLCLFQTTLAAVQNAKLMESYTSENGQLSRSSQEDDWIKLDPGQNMTMASFARSAAQALEPLPFINRDSIASLILMTDGVFGNMTGIAVVVSQILNMANLVLSSLPFGALLPILFQIFLTILMAPQTRFYAKCILYRLWLCIPSTNNDRYTVHVSDGDVIVTSASDTFPGQPSPLPFQPSFPSFPQLPQFLAPEK